MGLAPTSNPFAMLRHGAGHPPWSSGHPRYPWEETSQHWLSPKKPTDPERLSEKLSAAFEHNHKVLTCCSPNGQFKV